MDRSATPRLTAEQAAGFKRLAAPHLAVLLRTSMYLTHHDQLAEDLVQETMMKAMRAIDSFQEGTDIKAWLMTILGCTHIDIVRSNKLHAHTVSIEQTEIELADPRQDDGGKYDDRWNEPAALLERFGDREVIEALHWLPEEIRRTFLLMDVEQMDHSAAATILKVPVGTIKSGAHFGRAMLRDRLYLCRHESVEPFPRASSF